MLHAEHPLQHDNSEDQYAVAVINSGQVVGHVPRELSQTFWYFIEREGEISCIITGRRQRSPLLQGGMEIPCTYSFRGKKKLVDKLKLILKTKDIETSSD